jgi:hypothetical protein
MGNRGSLRQKKYSRIPVSFCPEDNCKTVYIRKFVAKKLRLEKRA